MNDINIANDIWLFLGLFISGQKLIIMLRVLSLSYRQGLAFKKYAQINNVKSSLL